MSCVCLNMPIFSRAAGCLVLSSAVVESDCLVGDYATVMAGAVLESGQSLKPFGTLSKEESVADDSIEEEFPHFYVERHMSKAQQFFSMIQALNLYCISLLPILVPLVYAMIACWEAWASLEDGGVLQFCRSKPLLVLSLCIELACAPFCLRYLSTKSIIWYKRTCVGKLSPGINLVQSGKSFPYSTYKRLLSYPYVQLGSVAKDQGLECSGISNYILSDFEMVQIGKGGNTNGNVHFRCIDKNGTFHSTKIRNRVSTGNCVLFPNCNIKEDSLVGNESSVPMGTIMDSGYQIQGSDVMKWPQGLKRGAGVDSKTVPPSKAQVMQILRSRMYFWGPFEFVWVNGISLAVGFYGYKIGTLVLLSMLPVIVFFRMTFSLLWIRFRRWSVGYTKMVQAGQSQTGENILEFALFRMCSTLSSHNLRFFNELAHACPIY